MYSTNTKEISTERALGQATVSLGKDLFVGIDTSKVWQVVTRLDPADGKKPAEKMHTDTLLKRVAGWIKQGFKVHCVYETGPTGFDLARRLIALGATCLVVRAKRTERYGRKRKNDRMDSRHLVEDLAAHYFGRTGLLKSVRIPSTEEELRRLAVRELESLEPVMNFE